MTLDIQSAAQLLFGLLSPDMFAAAERLRSGEKRLVHYTTAENALNIIQSEQFWLRNVRCMDDYSEVQHGITLLLKVFSENDHARRERLIRALDQVAVGSAKAGIDAFDEWIRKLPDETYIGCLSEFDEADSAGRLSMWRAYSTTKAGVAVVMNSHPFLAETDALKAYSVSVAYLTDQEFADRMDNCLQTIEQNLEQVRALPPENITHIVFWWLLFLAVSLKHPAFVEEREWRIIYLPSMEKSDVIVSAVECIRGIPQVVEKIPLLNAPERGLDRADLNSLLHRVIIGPSDYPLVLYDAFVKALTDKGVENVPDRMSVSFIPLRN